jgi:effector-binding domain-containing protein
MAASFFKTDEHNIRIPEEFCLLKNSFFYGLPSNRSFFSLYLYCKPSSTVMKKGILFILGLVIIGTIAIYLLIPREKQIWNTVVIGATPGGTTRLLQDSTSWRKWWPAHSGREDSLYYNGYIFLPVQQPDNKYQVLIKKKDTVFTSTIQFLPAGDSTEMLWESKMAMGGAPWEKLRSYLQAREIGNSMRDLSASLKNYLEQSEHIYEFKIERVKLPSAYVVAVNASFNHYPNTTEIYSYISQLNNYIQTTDAKATGLPMLNVSETGNNGRFQAMIGLPVDREPPVKAGIFINRIVASNAITTKVKGGTNTTRRALAALYNYLRDYELVSTSFPFESLITDRLTEGDTSRWETEVYMPVN